MGLGFGAWAAAIVVLFMVGVSRVLCSSTSRALPTVQTFTPHPPVTTRNQPPPRLEELDISNNSISTLPPQLGLLSPSQGGCLRALMLQGNCIRTVRRPLLEGGTGALLDYLVTRLPQ